MAKLEVTSGRRVYYCNNLISIYVNTIEEWHLRYLQES